jgi:hypothetical protein
MAWVTPPGWYPDPGGQRLWRWWNGSQWTVHTAPVGPYVAQVLPEHVVAEERGMARWARIALPVYALTTIGTLLLTWSFFQGFAGFAEGAAQMPSGELPSGEIPGPPPEFGRIMMTGLAAQPLSLLSYACIIVLAIWFYRAAKAGEVLGIPARRSPGWATASWFIPVVNLWWPCQSSRDLLPDGHPIRPRITQLWVASLVAGFLLVLGWFAVMFDAIGDAMRAISETTPEPMPFPPEIPGWMQALAVVGLVTQTAVMIAARGVVAAVLAEHQRLLERRGATT